jgi:hypothetical protein
MPSLNTNTWVPHISFLRGVTVQPQKPGCPIHDGFIVMGGTYTPTLYLRSPQCHP